jgi:hypothetical protein
MKFDITELLQEWDFTPGQVVARRFVGKDGREKIQLRVDLGVLQMNAEGRPDGRRPMAHESWFDFLKTRRQDVKTKNEGNDDSFSLGPTECAKLQQEAIQYHHRYICFFQLEDYAAVERDTLRNLEVFEFVDEYAQSDELAWTVIQFTPQLLMMRTRARGMAALRERQNEIAIAAIEEGIEDLEEFYRGSGRENLIEESGEIGSLRQWLDDVRNQRASPDISSSASDAARLSASETEKISAPNLRKPMTELEKLEDALAEAIRLEDYETAASVRDKLRKLQASES